MSKIGKVPVDGNGVVIGALAPLFSHTSMVTGASTSVVTATAFREDTLAVLLQPNSSCFVKFGESSNVVAASTDHPLFSGVTYTFAVKGARYLAVIGNVSLRVTELG